VNEPPSGKEFDCSDVPKPMVIQNFISSYKLPEFAYTKINPKCALFYLKEGSVVFQNGEGSNI
jgi:hypothetical protein